MWIGKLQDQYSNFEDFQAYAETYGLLERLGFDAEAAWDANPMIKGSTDPSDYGILMETQIAAINVKGE